MRHKEPTASPLTSQCEDNATGKLQATYISDEIHVL